MLTSPTIRRLPTFIRFESPRRFLEGTGFLKKFIFKFVVTAKTTDPMVFNIAAYMARSASSIIDGPETVPPGRK